MATDKRYVDILKNLGFSDGAARVYIAALELGEATVQDLGKRSKVPRTTIYYLLSELIERSALVMTKRGKKSYYVAAPPKTVLARAKDGLNDFENSLEELEGRMHAVYPKPRIYFLHGPQGFKQIWDMIFDSHEKEYSIITEGASFLDFVKEKYVIDDIIKRKRALGIKSRQLIMDSPYAREIVAKDARENRESKILSPKHKLPFTEIITKRFVVFISPRWDNTLFVVENENFAVTRNSLFEAMWQTSLGS
jgi:HTH-type transcriptional regulator, sugar sensing transcriptional regulator